VVVSGGTYVVLATGTLLPSKLHYAVLPRGNPPPSPEAVVAQTAEDAVVAGAQSLPRANTTTELGIGGMWWGRCHNPTKEHTWRMSGVELGRSARVSVRLSRPDEVLCSQGGDTVGGGGQVERETAN
jgi:hypothetical protein